ncbi:uncharacterized protein [Rutidosis leptorrhynchoides]|uniref:uncharacterized protein n=1 Tax=Rutidosis leptorrhynchoides TaxID=125765 RepID=UPI003A995D75
MIRFPRLYRLETDQSATVKDRMQLVNNSWIFQWAWARHLSGRLVGELEQLISVVSTSSCFDSDKDRWVFSLDKSGVYTCKSVAAKLDTCLLSSNSPAIKTIRNNLVPQKVGIFVWRVLKGRIATLVELDKRGIDLGSILCATCGNEIESIDHALFKCKSAVDVWKSIHKW